MLYGLLLDKEMAIPLMILAVLRSETARADSQCCPSSLSSSKSHVLHSRLAGEKHILNLLCQFVFIAVASGSLNETVAPHPMYYTRAVGPHAHTGSPTPSGHVAHAQAQKRKPRSTLGPSGCDFRGLARTNAKMEKKSKRCDSNEQSCLSLAQLALDLRLPCTAMFARLLHHADLLFPKRFSEFHGSNQIGILLQTRTGFWFHSHGCAS